MGGTGWRLLAGLIVFGALVRAVVAPVTFGDDFDMQSYRIVGDALLDGSPFNTYDQISSGDFTRSPYPPGYWPVIASFTWLERHAGLELETGIHLLPILADCAIAFLVWVYLGSRGSSERVRLFGAGLIALGPSLAWVSGYHGHFDSVAILPAVVALMLWQKPELQRRALAAGLLVGLGASFKTIPILMLVALLPTARSLREAAVLCASAAAVPLLMLVPFALSAPSGIELIATYEGVGGLGGLSLLAQPSLARLFIEGIPPEGFNAPTRFLLDFGSLLLAGALVALMVIMVKKRTPAPLAAVVLWLTVYTLGYSFAHHYMVWGIPFFVMAGYLRETLILQVAVLPLRVLLLAPLQGVGWSALYAAGMLGLWLAMAITLVHLVRRIITGGVGAAPARV